MINNGRHSVHQDIRGNGQQIAGRDLINEGDGFKPDPNNPNLRECDYCGWPGLALDAHACSKCGHSYLADYLAQQHRARQEFARFKAILMGGLILSFLGALQLSDWLGLNIIEGILVVALVAGCLWGAAIQIRGRFGLWLARYKRRNS